MMRLCRAMLFAALPFASTVVQAQVVASAQNFSDAPISCGSMIQFKGCTAAFDGQTLRLTFTPPEGKPSLAIYRHCVSTPIIIHCPGGHWQSELGAVPLGARSIGLRDQKPYPD